MNRMQHQVQEFCEKFGIPTAKHPELWDRELRRKLIAEEAIETITAIDQGDFECAIDGLCDLAYVVFQAAAVWGIDLQEFFDEVHRANMAKEGGGKRADGKILKPAGWTPPDIAGILRRGRELPDLAATPRNFR